MNQAADKSETDVVNIRQARPSTGPAAEHPMLSTALVDAWLAWQCRMISGLFRGAVIGINDGGELGEMISTWPEQALIRPEITRAAQEATRIKSGVVQSRVQYSDNHEQRCDVVASPLLLHGKPLATLVVLMSPRAELQQQAVLQLLRWGGLWVETLLKQTNVNADLSSGFTLQLAKSIMNHSKLQASAMEVVNRIAHQFLCERVSIGFVEGLSVRLQAISNLADFDSRVQVVQKIEAAMTEAVDQEQTISYCPRKPELSTVSTANRELAEQHSRGAVCSVLLHGRDKVIGVLTLERIEDQPFDQRSISTLESVADLIGSVLESRREAERKWITNGGEAIKNAVASLFGMSHLKTKLVAAVAALMIGLLAVLPGTYRVAAPASIEGSVKQVLTSPVAGYVEQANVRAGDLVKSGQVVAELDDRPLQLELRKWETERNKIEKEYQDALATRDRSKLSILRARIAQVDAEIKLVEQDIAHTRLQAPYDGIVTSGDLSQKLGAPVELGQALFEIAPLDNYRIILEVDEHDVAALEPGKSGRLVMAALPGTVFEFTLGELQPVAVSGEGNNYFRVEADLNEPSALLRPGMRGVAKVDAGEHSLLWNMTHRLVERLRLWFWSAGL